MTVALILVYGIGELLFKSREIKCRALLFLLVIVTFAGKSLSGARNVFCAFVIGLVVLGAYGLRRNRMLYVGVGVVGLLALHSMSWYQPRMMSNYGQMLPYMTKLDRPGDIRLDDFVPRLNNKSLDGRAHFWRTA